LSGHSKWANIKHRKAAQDAKRGNLFQKLVRAIIVAAREGGGDPAMNARLKTAIDRARAASVPMDNITRGIKRGTGEIEGASYEELTYEGYGSGGIAILIETLTDNKNRTTSELRTILSRNGGSMGEAGCVAWMFERKGVIEVKGEELEEEELMLEAIEAGADDIERSEEGFLVYCEPTNLSSVKESLEKAGYAIDKADTDMIPKTSVPVEDADKARKILKLMDLIEDQDDVQNVYANFDIPDEMINALEG
jgi:YebC/PmpR family DNA-binding regulatory protein